MTIEREITLSQPSALLRVLRLGLAGDRLPIFIICVSVVLGIGLRLALGVPPVPIQSYLHNIFLASIGIYALAIIGVLYVLARDRPDSPIQYFRDTKLVKRAVLSLVQALPLLLFVFLFMPVFGGVKSTIGMLQPYSWDETFIRWDEVLHGADVWLLMQPVLGKPEITYVISILYQVWILLLYVAFPFVCLHRSNEKVRRQMIVSYLLSWIVIGSIMAHFFASVGPCFLEPITGNDRFVPQMEYLLSVNEEYPLMMLQVQEILLESYLNGEPGLGRGISAMPSMHIAIAALFTIYAWRLSRAWGIIAGLFLLVTYLGSVHLAYHYAVDAYVSIAAVIFIWWFSGRIVDWFDRNYSKSAN